jgi:hypothetical protein
MWEESLIFMLIYLGVFFILPDKIRNKHFDLVVLFGVLGFIFGLYVIKSYLRMSEQFLVQSGCGPSGKPCATSCTFTANISATGALTNISTRSCGLIQGMTISNAAKTLPLNIVLSTYTGGTTGQLTGQTTFTAGTDTFTGTIKPYCLINERILPKTDFDQTVAFNIYGRYVRIYASPTVGDGYFGLSQVVVNNAAGTNIALGKATTATSNLSGAAAASTVVDGNLSMRKWPVWHNNNAGRATDYWQVDLGSVQMVTTIRVIARSDYGERVGIAAGHPNRTQGLRIVVLNTPTDTPTQTGVCIAEPTIVFPTGTTTEEQDFLGPLILDGMNGQTALNIFRGIRGSTVPTNLTQFGLTDSQAARAYAKLYSENMMNSRNKGTINDTAYYNGMNAVKNVTTIASITFDRTAALTTFMANNRTNENRPALNANGTPIIETSGAAKDTPRLTNISDNGARKTTAAIMGTTMPGNEDPSAGYSGETKATNDVPAPPDTKTWSSNAVSSLASMPVAINIPVTPPIIVDPDTTPEQIAAATVSSTTLSGQDPGSTAMRSAAGGAASAVGYTAPAASQAAPQWYHLTGYTYTRDSGAAACAAFGGKMATKQQVIDAQANGASICSAGYVSDDTARVYFPGQPGHCWGNGLHSQAMGDSAACCGGKWAVNCFGIKPPPATPGVAPWTDVAVTKNNNKYIANDWSERKGGQGTDANPGTPIATQEVYWVGLGTGWPNYNYSGPDAESICKAAGGDLATVTQVQAAQQRGAQWEAWGWVKGGTVAYPMQNASGTVTRGTTDFIKVVNDGNGDDFVLPTAAAIQTIPIYKRARYVRLLGSLTAGDGWLNFSYLRVNDENGNNISANKPAFFSQNTVTWDSGTPASAVVTGAEGTRPSWNVGFHARAQNTAANDSAIWQVDLGSEHLISTIVYYGRSDCCLAGSGNERNRGVRIRLFTGYNTAGANCVGVKPPPVSVTAIVPTSDFTQTIQINKKGRFVRLRGSLTSGDGWLQISYLRVNDKNGNNISAGKTAYAWQKTVVWDSQTAATNPIIGVEGRRNWQGLDGNVPNPLNFFHAKAANTTADDSAYWQVDLGSEQDISTIVYHARNDCCGAGSGNDRIRGVRIEVASTPVPAPFSTNSSPHAYNQNSYTNTGACPSGTTRREGCPGGPACIPNSEKACGIPKCPQGATQGC